MGLIRNTLFAVTAMILAACATGTTLSETPAASEPMSRDTARIVVYRTGIMGAAIQPQVLVDGQETSTCQPNSVFFVDVAPGQHSVTASTESTSTVKATLGRGSQVYVECSIGFGLMIGRPQLRVVEAETARSVIGGLVYSGRYALN